MSSTDTDTTPRPSVPGRCFICLMDQEGSDDWVNPCPCTLEGHQDCMMSWMAELERQGKPFACPICKSEIIVDEPFDPALAIGNRIYKAFSSVSPLVLCSGALSGLYVSLTAYGSAALLVFSGPEGYSRFLLTGDADLPVLSLRYMTLPLIAPALVIGQTLPALGNFFFLPPTSIYGMFSMAHDENFISWPPSPGLVFATFPWIRAIYRNIWREFIRPYEMRLDRRIAGVPEPEPQADQGQGQGQERARDDQANDNDGDGAGGIVGFLDAAINLLDIPEVDLNVEIQEDVLQPGEQDRPMEVEMEMEMRLFDGGVANDDEEAAEEIMVLAGPGPRDDAAGDQGENQANHGDDAAPAPVVLPAPAEAGAQDQAVAEAPAAAEPADGQRQWNVHASLRDIGNSLAASLLLPAISAGAGELLRLALPRRMTTPSLLSCRRPGLLQEMWGRSLVGGCIYLVLRDAFRLYTKYRRAVNKPLRKVRNVERRKGEAAASSS
ncbi:hypothetical protein ACRALDRAFT_1075317 [Sodiomyces alcalophilus JCM 7366]|uniref:uncharacterized protein n=1 Tax=Sodiomyces alcalophilus JCM 7366 TaxID=591952 RepID=UPI0039B59F14